MILKVLPHPNHSRILFSMLIFLVVNPSFNPYSKGGAGEQELRILSVFAVLWSHPELPCAQTLSCSLPLVAVSLSLGAGQGLAGFEGHTCCAVLCCAVPKPSPSQGTRLGRLSRALQGVQCWGCTGWEGLPEPWKCPLVSPSNGGGSAAAPGPAPAVSSI